MLFRSLDDVIVGSLSIKRNVVEKDERETSLRRVLNFGHTVGHAFEKAGRYETWTHGQAVAAGMNRAAELGVAAGVTPAEVAAPIADLIEKFGLPGHIPCPWDTVTEAVGLDKKRAGDDITMIFLSRLGKAAPTKLKKDELLALLHPVFGA